MSFTFFVKSDLGICLGRRKAKGLELFLRKLILSSSTVLGAGYALNNVSMIIMLQYYLSQLPISSVQNVLKISGILLFILASVAFIALGVLLVVGAFKYYRGSFSRGFLVLGVLLGSFYLLCLGLGSVLLTSDVNLSAVLLILSPMLFMVAIAAHLGSSYRSKFVSSVFGLLGAILFTVSIFPTFGLQVFRLVFPEWDVPFPGPFMSLAVVEGPALVLGSSAVFVHSIFAGRRKGYEKYLFYPIATLVYGIGLFIGPLTLSLSLLDLLWKAPWVGPVYNAPNWIFDIVTFWSASLVMLVFGGVLLVLSSYVGFFFVFSTIEE